MSSRESRWAGGEGLRVGLMIAAVLLGPMLLRAVGLPPGVVLMLLFLVPMLMQGLGRFRRGGAGERGRDAGEQEAAGDLAGEDAGPAPRPTLGEALAPFRRGCLARSCSAPEDSPRGSSGRGRRDPGRSRPCTGR
ncbi:Uncharacterised protein [Rothia kristinae]|nr:Uncharacterised protein [Rothia kristinae]